MFTEIRMAPPPDKDDPKARPSKRPAGDLSPEERKLWADDDLEELEDLDDLDDLDKKPDRGDSKRSTEAPEDPLPPSSDDPSPAAPGPAPPETPPATVTDAVRAAPRLNRAELVWMGVLSLVLLGGIIYFITLIGSNINTSEPPEVVDFPVEGQNVVIGDIETFWRKPRDEDQGVRLEAKLIPCATIKLKSGSGSGALRFFFEDPDGNNIGDSVTLEFSNGAFSSTGDAQAEIYCTGGMADEGEYAAYLTEELSFWHLIALEGPGPKASGSEFKQVLKMRISTNRR